VVAKVERSIVEQEVEEESSRPVWLRCERCMWHRKQRRFLQDSLVPVSESLDSGGFGSWNVVLLWWRNDMRWSSCEFPPLF